MNGGLALALMTEATSVICPVHAVVMGLSELGLFGSCMPNACRSEHKSSSAGMSKKKSGSAGVDQEEERF